MKQSKQIVLSFDELKEAIKEYVSLRSKHINDQVRDSDVVIDVRLGGVMARDARVEGAILTSKGEEL